jgi:membrane associated rhomboid family serine protease
MSLAGGRSPGAVLREELIHAIATVEQGTSAMGIYDRDYYQPESRGFSLGGPRLMVTKLVLINVAVYAVHVLLFSQNERFVDLLALQKNLFTHPWQCYQLLTYGFLHDPHDVWHIIGNMLVLWFLGREVETIYGQRQFLEFYLSTIILGGLVWVISENLIEPGGKGLVLGASGGVTGVAMIFVMHYPRRLVYLYFLIPIPIWVLAAVMLLTDTVRAINHYGSVASSVHLTGAALGYLFYRTQWQLGRWLPQHWSLGWLAVRPGLRLHSPREEEDDDALKAEVDRILEKISREGEASLSQRERRTLEDASRRYQRRGPH